jgi:putative hydrolase of the HAD superfamily
MLVGVCDFPGSFASRPPARPVLCTCRSRASLKLETVPDSPPPSIPQAGSDGRVFGGVIADWGGVMTGPILTCVRAWLDAEDIDHDSYAAIMRPWLLAAYTPGQPESPVHALERGECGVAEFERRLAARLRRRDGGRVVAEGLLSRMFAASTRCEQMYGAIRAARVAGLRTGLLSNSWGDSDYPRHELAEMFDAVVISADVGMRKPEERIFLHAAALLELEPSECVFVDDVEANIIAAEAVGMTGVLHRDPDTTLARLTELLPLVLPVSLPAASGGPTLRERG